MRARLAAAAVLCLALGASARADEPAPTPSSAPAPATKPPKPRSAAGIAWTALAYVPNRVFDLCDVVRLRARFGDGFAAGARITRYLPLFVGTYDAAWVGLPGPRGEASIPIPLGYERKAGVDAGPIAISSQHSQAPRYGVGEIGAGLQVYLVGAEAGVDVYELADFFAGFVLVDFARDDF